MSGNSHRIQSRRKESRFTRNADRSSSQTDEGFTLSTHGGQVAPKVILLKRSEVSQPSGATSTTPASTSTSAVTIQGNSGTEGNTKTPSDRNGNEKAPQILQRNAIPTTDGGSTTGISLYDLLKPYEFPYQSAIPLIYNDMGFRRDTSFLKPVKSATDYLVITAIGPPGSGKSTLLNQLSGGLESKLNFDGTIFNVKPSENRERESLFWISTKNIVFIEMSSIFSGAAALSLIPHIEKYSTLEATTVIWNLRLMRWALSVSHLVLVVNSMMLDPKIFKLINAASMLEPLESAFGENSHPELLFVANKIRLEDVPSKNLEEWRCLYNSTDVLGFGRRARIKKNAFILPHMGHSDPKDLETMQIWEEFRRTIYEYNQWTRSTFGEEVEGQSKIPQTLSLGDWFTFGQNLWEEMNAGSYYHDYVKLLPIPS